MFMIAWAGFDTHSFWKKRNRRRLMHTCRHPNYSFVFIDVLTWSFILLNNLSAVLLCVQWLMWTFFLKQSQTRIGKSQVRRPHSRLRSQQHFLAWSHFCRHQTVISWKKEPMVDICLVTPVGYTPYHRSNTHTLNTSLTASFHRGGYSLTYHDPIVRCREVIGPSSPQRLWETLITCRRTFFFGSHLISLHCIQAH